MRNSKGQFVKGSAGHLGHKHSQETKKIIGKKNKSSLKGRNFGYKFTKGNKVNVGRTEEKSYQWKGGLPHCLDCGKKLSSYIAKKCTKCGINKGNDHYNWKGGITPINKQIRSSIEYKLWRKSVFERDNYTCQNCGQIGGYLEVDHIKPFAYFPELRFKTDNGRTLCKPCHRKTDTFAGKGFTRVAHTGIFGTATYALYISLERLK